VNMVREEENRLQLAILASVRNQQDILLSLLLRPETKPYVNQRVNGGLFGNQLAAEPYAHLHQKSHCAVYPATAALAEIVLNRSRAKVSK